MSFLNLARVACGVLDAKIADSIARERSLIDQLDRLRATRKEMGETLQRLSDVKIIMAFESAEKIASGEWHSLHKKAAP